MSQDTRKDPRAKVLTMTVRYKSATLDEFIEHHSYDVSRGGMFIKTPSPFPPGTLLKFEVKIAADQKVIQGVGRVVWKRDSETQADVRPAGMGVKFIKIDDASRKVIDTLVETRGDATSAYEAGGGDTGNVPAATTTTPGAMSAKAPAATADAPKPPNMRKSTMIGLGAMNPSNRPPVVASADKPAASFFPETKSEAEMPAPEDRTVMKQAAELLQDALREAGGSMSEVGGTPKPADPPAKTAAAPESKRSAESPVSAPPAASAESKPKPISEKPAASVKPTSVKPAASAKPASSKPAPAVGAVTIPATRKVPAAAAAPASRRVSVPAAAPAKSSAGGGSRVVVIALVLAATGGLVYAFSAGKPPEPPPTSSAEPVVPAAPVVTAVPPAVPASASALPVESAAPPPVAPIASASASASASHAAVAPAVPPVAAAPVIPKPAIAPRPVAKPKPAVVAQPSAPSEPAAPSQPTAEKPVTPPPAAAEKPVTPPPTTAPEAPAPKPVAKPKPAEPAGDNPY